MLTKSADGRMATDRRLNWIQGKKRQVIPRSAPAIFSIPIIWISATRQGCPAARFARPWRALAEIRRELPGYQKMAGSAQAKSAMSSWTNQMKHNPCHRPAFSWKDLSVQRGVVNLPKEPLRAARTGCRCPCFFGTPDYAARLPGANHRAAASALSSGSVLKAIAAPGAAL